MERLLKYIHHEIQKLCNTTKSYEEFIDQNGLWQYAMSLIELIRLLKFKVLGRRGNELSNACFIKHADSDINIVTLYVQEIADFFQVNIHVFHATPGKHIKIQGQVPRRHHKNLPLIYINCKAMMWEGIKNSITEYNNLYNTPQTNQDAQSTQETEPIVIKPQ